jgi:hypothetical protein
VTIVMKSGSLNLLEPSGPVKACNGIALPVLLQAHPLPAPTHATTRTSLIAHAVSNLPAHTSALTLRSDSYVAFRILQFVVTVMFGTCSLTSVVSQIACIRVQVEGQAGGQFQSHSGEVLVVGELPVSRHGRSETQR